MSESKIILDSAEIPIYRVYQPALDVNQPKKYIAYRGAQSVVWQKLPTTSISNSQITWQINTPSVKTGINRHVYVEVEVQARLLGGNGNAIPDDKFGGEIAKDELGLRNLPLQSACDTASLDLNSSRFSWNPRGIIAALYAYNIDRKAQRTFFSVSGGMPEHYSSYIRDNLGGRDPLQLYEANASQNTRHIKNFLFEKVTGQVGVFRVKWFEPVLIPPLSTSAREAPCLYGINNFNLNFVMGDLGRLFSVGADPAVATDFGSIDSITINSATLHLQYYTFDLTYPLPPVPVWSVSDISNHITTAYSPVPDASILNYGNTSTTTTPANLGEITTTSVNLNQIPKAIYVFAKRRNGSDNARTPDNFLRITKISVDFNNRSGLLSTMTEVDIYNMAVKNGLQMDWAQVQRVGLPLCLLPAEDLSLGDAQAPGLIGQFNLQIQITFAAPYSMDTAKGAGTGAENDLTYPIVNNFDCYVCPVYEGVCWLSSSGILMTKFGSLSENAILSAPIEFNSYENYIDSTLYGGNIFGKISSFAKDAWNGIRKVLPVASDVASAIAPLVSARNPSMGQAISTAANIGRAVSGRGGSAYVSRKVLKSRMK